VPRAKAKEKTKAKKRADTQVTEILGRNRLINELVNDGLEVAVPLRDSGIDLIAYAAFQKRPFVGFPIQMKAATKQSFSIDRKYSRFKTSLVIVFVWNLGEPAQSATYALTYDELLKIAKSKIAKKKDYTKTKAWKGKGYYASNRPSKELVEMLKQYLMHTGSWRKKIEGMIKDVATTRLRNV